MKKLIAFSGGMGAGKDTMREYLIKELNFEKEYHFSFALPLKDEANKIIDSMRLLSDLEISMLFQVNIEDVQEARKILGDTVKSYPEVNSRSRTPEIRKFLQFWGTDVRRKQDTEYWVLIAESMINKKIQEGFTVIVTDARFENELELINKIGGVTICLSSSETTRVKRIIERDNLKPSRESLDHASEQGWKNFHDYSLVINNDNQSEKETIEEIIEYLSKN